MITAPAVLDPGAVSGLVAVTDSTNDPTDARFVSTYGIPGVPAYQQLAQAEVADVMGQYVKALGDAE